MASHLWLLESIHPAGVVFLSAMEASGKGELQVQIQTDTPKNPVTLTVLGPVPSAISRVSSVITHTKPASQSFTPTTAVNSNKSRVFACNDEQFSTRLESGPVLVKLTYNMRDKHAIVTMVDKSHFILTYTNSLPTQPKSSGKSVPFSNSDPQNWLRSAYSLSKEPKNHLRLSMAPPINSSPVQKSDHEDTINDPFDYFLDKYFENLYLLNTPLTFFTKSVFARLRTLCVDDMNVYESMLGRFLLKVDQFDARHLVSNNGLLNSYTLFEKEEIYRKKFIQKSLNLVDFDIHSTNFQETNRSLTTILNDFKIREIQIQMLILLELIYVTDKDDAKLFNAKKKKGKKQKRKLVGKKKLTTVISGGAISLNESAESETNEDMTYNQLLDVNIDRLMINDLLNGSGTTSATKFMSYIVVPFFDKKCPNSVRYMIKKIKGPSFKSSNKDKKRSSSQTDVIASKKPTLERTNSSSSSFKLEDIPELKMSLTRSNSDLQSLKRTSSFNASNLSKRQVDMSIPVLEPKPMKRAPSQIFNRVGKKINTTSITSSSLKITESFSQVEATPMKKSKTVDVMQTPADSKPGNKDVVNSVGSSIKDNSIHSSSPVVERTPMQPSLQSPIAIRSTVRRPGDPIDLSDRLMGSPSIRTKNVKRRLFAAPPDPK